jgi:hypothetical protein
MSEMTFNEIVRVQLPKEEFNNTINNKTPNNHIKSTKNDGNKKKNKSPDCINNKNDKNYIKKNFLF